MPSDHPSKARKGDVALVHQSHSTFTLGSGGGNSSRDSYALGVVRKATREGMVTEVDLFGGGIARKRDYSWKSVYLIPEVSASDAEKVAKAHHWEGHPNQVRAFDSLDDVRTALRPYRGK